MEMFANSKTPFLLCKTKPHTFLVASFKIMIVFYGLVIEITLSDLRLSIRTELDSMEFSGIWVVEKLF